MTCRIDRTRIGGEFELNLASFSHPADKAPPALPFAHMRWTDTGRSALFLVASDILRRGGEPLVWLPAFCCRSVMQAFEQAGFSTRYYSSTELHGENCCPQPDPIGGQTFLFVHYFGHINRQRLAQVAAWRRTGVYIIEDAAQAALTQGIGSAGHYAITSLRKLLPQPDGAMIGSVFEMNFSTADPDEEFVSGRALAKLMRGAGAPPETFLPLLHHTESCLDNGVIVPRSPSWLSRRLMARTDIFSVAERRRCNWELLRGWLRSLASHVTPLHETIEPGEVPLGLPVRVGGGCRDPLRRFLADHGIFCPVHWSLPHVPTSADLALDHELSSQILTLPIDQRMEESHVRRFIKLLQQFFADRQ